MEDEGRSEPPSTSTNENNVTRVQDNPHSRHITSKTMLKWTMLRDASVHRYDICVNVGGEYVEKQCKQFMMPWCDIFFIIKIPREYK